MGFDTIEINLVSLKIVFEDVREVDLEVFLEDVLESVLKIGLLFALEVRIDVVL